jgi:hypothetical protein
MSTTHSHEAPLPWPWRVPVIALAIHFFILFPAIHFGLRDWSWTEQYGHSAYWGLAVALVALRYPAALKTMGLANYANTLRDTAWGLILGTIIVGAVPLMDVLVGLSPLARNELLADSVNQLKSTPIVWPDIVYPVILRPLLAQVFFFGFIFNSLLSRFQPPTAFFFGAGIFCLGQSHVHLAGLLVGFASAGLFWRTRSILAGWAVQSACALAWIVLMHTYPRLITLFIFLF